MYWNIDRDCNVDIRRNKTRHNRFEKAMCYIYLVDNNKINGNDKLFKVRPLHDLINDNF